MALTALGIAAWAARRGVWAGVLLGLAVATKFYPLLIFGALLLLCLRAGKLRDFARTARRRRAGLAGGQPAGRADARRPAGPSSTRSAGPGAPTGARSGTCSSTSTCPSSGIPSSACSTRCPPRPCVVAFAAIALLALAAPRRPRLPQLCFLLLASFLMMNKVWSPQYVIWLVPLAVLARPRLWPYVLWQLAEVGYFFGIWGYLIFVYRDPRPHVAGYHGISTGWYFALLAGQVAHRSPARRLRGAGHSSSGTGRGACPRPRRPGGRCPGPGPGPLPDAAQVTGRARRCCVSFIARVIQFPRWSPRSPRTGRSAGPNGPCSLAGSGQLAVQPADVGGQPAVVLGRLADDRRAGGPDHAEQRAGSIVPASMLACRSRPEPNSSRELLQCTRSIRPVIALIRSTASARSMPAELAWQVSRQNPTSSPAFPAASVTASQQPADRLQGAGHRAVAAGGVLDQHRQRPLDALHRLAPVLQALGEVDARA